MPYSLKGVSGLKNDEIEKFSKVFENKSIKTQTGG
jgi:hypothetical protein